MVEKSLWAVVAALAILKAGGALVPLDPAHPEARRATIMRCTDARMAVTSDCLKYLFDGLPITAITISAVKASASHQSELSEVHLPVVTPKDPVFVLFTSGSTGEPKGIIHEHTGICSHAAAQVERMGYKGARVFQFSAFTFDVAMMDIFSTLIAGSTVCVPSEDERLNNIPAAIARMNADHALVTPSIASLISPNEVPTLKTLILGGESLNRKVIDHWVDHVQLMNAYGPAEVGACTVATVNRNQTRIETIGLPLPHCSCWVVDVNDHDELLPAGAIGELLVTGTTLARGYLNNKAKTDASFIRSPLWASRMGLTAAIFYKTGDLVRYNIDMLDGTLDYIGRKDAQVKLRGYRIELGEIEYHISTYPGVVRSVVLQPRQGYYAGQLVVIAQVISGTLDDNNDPLYIRTCDGPKVEAIQRHLAPFVPNYMLPSECIAVEMLPLNRSCKIDRNAVSQWLSNLAERPVQKASAHVQWYPLIDKSNALAVSICARISELVAERDVEFAALIKGRDIPLEKLELDSIQLMTLTMYLRRTYGSCITLGHMRPGTTVTKIANLIASGRVNEAHDLPSEFNVGIEANSIFEEMTGELLADGPNTTCQNPAPILNVFLTGATGFLGLEILRQLLHQPKIKIFVLLRCGTDMEGYERILRMAKEHGWWKDGFARRIHVWPGDLTQPDLGLSPGALSQLTGEAPRTNSIDAIIHCAARVHYTYDYQTLKPANVDSTVQLLKTMAGTTTISAFLYVSGGEAPNAERHKLDNASSPDYANGYSQSKLVSELIVTRCAQHSLFQGRRLKIVRPGYIIGSPAQPRPVTTDFIWRLVAGCLDIKAYNGETLSQWIYISDVESVGQVVVDSVLDQTCTTTYFPVLGGLSLGEFWGVLSTDIGYHLEPLAEEEWLQALEADILRRRESHPLFPFLLIIRQEAKSLGSKISHVRDSRVKRAVLGNIQYLINVGFLPRPLSN
ncbi:hypothetical protein BDV41DRAFT_587139 [Aspergillus transmontanensis]|uniref:Carrier domain-containing protein n=1 Tax=Aspergillus transmontanensis TaxID=1034304 RepID=A0A5N6W1J5_9EURO|nr:hypothetical protein BDV41DRAFT_587139 [Aspergillus transmontanensis]